MDDEMKDFLRKQFENASIDDIKMSQLITKASLNLLTFTGEIKEFNEVIGRKSILTIIVGFAMTFSKNLDESIAYLEDAKKEIINMEKDMFKQNDKMQ